MKTKMLGDGSMKIVTGTRQLTHLPVPRTCRGGVEGRRRLKAPFQNPEKLLAAREQLVNRQKGGFKAFVPGRIRGTSYDSEEETFEISG